MIEWININKEWLFSGIGITLFSTVVYLFRFCRKSKKPRLVSKQIGQQTQHQNVVINMSSPLVDTANEQAKMVGEIDKKATTNILFVDDEKFDHVSVLKSAGWKNTKNIKDIKRIDCSEIQWAQIIFIDINGVGCDLFPKEQGLGVAVQIKKRYPDKYVVVYSAQPQQLNKNFTQVDAILPKNADPYEYINILENYTNF